MVAYALEMDPVLLPHAVELLADLDALGADVELVVQALVALAIRPGDVVVDLGSGKGAVARAIAQRLGCTVYGVDLHEPFVQHANDAARADGLVDRCRFLHADVADAADLLPLADVAVFAAMGDVLGPVEATIGIVRRFVRPGGHLVINDSCRVDEPAGTFPGFEHCGTLAETRARLTSHGDELVAELLEANDDDLDERDRPAARAAALEERHPDLAPALRAFVRGQRDEYAFLAEQTIGAVWVLRRAGEQLEN